jgi:UDP-N-acetylglucosamine 2-epimerase (non-hydrolysing)
MKNRKADVCIILGTRPEIIKFFPIIKELEINKISYFVIHTNQHYDFRMDGIFFNELKLKPKIINLNILAKTHGEFTGKAIIKIEKTLIKNKPKLVMVQGDTNSAMAGAIAAVKLHIDVYHIEAGLRSYDIRQPEEYNRKIIDHISSYLFAPSKYNVKTLLSENINNNKIYLTGNTSVDAIKYIIKGINQEPEFKKGTYLLVTIHRQENVDSKERLTGIIAGITEISKRYFIPIVIPLHPRTEKRIKEFSLSDKINDPDIFKILSPLGIYEMISLEKNAKLILTDSGGIIEEACTLNIPSVSLRNFSDRPEAIQVGASILGGTESNTIITAAIKMFNVKTNWINPFGRGNAGKNIVKIIIGNINSEI